MEVWLVPLALTDSPVLMPFGGDIDSPLQPHSVRLPANQVLQEKIEHLLTRPVGRPPRKPVVWFADFKYQAASWDRPRRVIAKVEWHGGELFPRVGFIVTNRSARAQGVVHFYNGRGRAEQWIKEGKYALNWTRLSCQHFVPNQVRLALFVLGIIH